MIIIRDEATPFLKNLFAQRRMITFTSRLSIDGENALKNETKKNSVTGTADREIFSNFNKNMMRIYGTAKHLFISLETGRKPGRMPNTKALQKWADRKGINVPGFVLAKRIAMFGTRKYREKGPKQFTRFWRKFEHSIIPKNINKFLDSIK